MSLQIQAKLPFQSRTFRELFETRNVLGGFWGCRYDNLLGYSPEILPKHPECFEKLPHHSWLERRLTCISRRVSFLFRRISLPQWRSQISGDGVKLVIEGPPGQVGPLKKRKLVVFRLLYFRRTPLGPGLGPLEPRVGP